MSEFNWPWTISAISRKFLNEKTQVIKVQTGTPVLQESKTCDMVFQLVKGRLKVFKKSKSGGEQILYYVEPGQICVIGLQSCLLWQPAVANSVATEESELACISAKDFACLLQDSPEICQEVVNYIDSQLKELTQQYQKAKAGIIEAHPGAQISQAGALIKTQVI